MRALARTWIRWTEWMVVGMFLGVALAIWIAAAAISHGLAMPMLSAAAAAIAIAAAAGLAEGGVVGIAQSVEIRRAFHVSPVKWAVATAAATSLAWAAVMALNIVMIEYDVSTSVVASVIVVAGAALGSLVGAAQWIVLRGRAATWIAANALAWVAGTGVAIGIATLLGPGRTPLAAFLTLSGIGVAVGVVAGAITGAALVWRLRAEAP